MFFFLPPTSSTSSSPCAAFFGGAEKGGGVFVRLSSRAILGCRRSTDQYGSIRSLVAKAVNRSNRSASGKRLTAQIAKLARNLFGAKTQFFEPKFEFSGG